MYTYKQYLCTMYLCKTFQQHIFTYGEFSALNSGRKLVSVNQWAVNVPDAAADVFASWIQSVWGGRWAAEQSSQSAEDERHLNSGPGEKHLGATLSTKPFLWSYSPWNQIERQRLSIFPPSPLSHLSWVVLRLQGSQSPRVSLSHFLGKSEQLPAIQRRTEHFKDGWTLTQNTQTHTSNVNLFPRIHCWQSYRMWWRTPSSSL